MHTAPVALVNWRRMTRVKGCFERTELLPFPRNYFLTPCSSWH